MSMFVLEQLQRHAAENGDTIAVQQVAPACIHVESLTFANLLNAVNAASQHLATLSKPGDVAILQSHNAPEYIIAFLAALQSDLTIFPIHAQATQFELKAAVDATDARLYIGRNAENMAAFPGSASYIPLVGVSKNTAEASTPARTGEHGAMLLQSSGTTGTPRIVRRTAPSLDAVARNVQQAIGLHPNDRILTAIPLYHSYGVEHGLLAPIVGGCSVHLCDGFDPATVCKQLATGGITVFPAVPFMIEALAERAMGAPTLRNAYSAGGPLPASAFTSFYNRTGVRVGQVYGSSEAGSLTFNNPHHAGFDPHSVGKPMNNVKFRIVDPDAPDKVLTIGNVGEVTVSAPSMLENYINDDAQFIDGYLRTGDLGSLDSAGNLTIVGRVKLQIDIGGAKVNPLEIERIIHEFPGVGECVVVPVRVTDTVDRLKAIIVPLDHQTLCVESIRAFVRGRLAPYKVPRLFELRRSLPKSATGKILREALRCE